MNTYRLEFQPEGQVERYLGQVHILYQGHRSKIKGHQVKESAFKWDASLGVSIFTVANETTQE